MIILTLICELGLGQSESKSTKLDHPVLYRKYVTNNEQKPIPLLVWMIWTCALLFLWTCYMVYLLAVPGPVMQGNAAAITIGFVVWNMRYVYFFYVTSLFHAELDQENMQTVIFVSNCKKRR